MPDIRNFLFVTVFVAILIVSGAWTLFSEDHKQSLVENRNLAQMPNANLKNLMNGKYAADLESYLSDQFFGREYWLQYLFELQAAAYFSDISGVVKGKENYLLEIRMYNQTVLSNINHNVKMMTKLAEIVGLDRLYVAVAPRQTQANQDRLPFYAVNNADEYTDLYLGKLPADISKIDLRSVIYNNIHADDLYFRTDHHWNINGTYLAYEEILNVIRKSFPQIPGPYTKADYTVSVGTNQFYGSLARRTRNVYDVPPDRIELWYPKNYENTIITVGGKEHPEYFNLEILNGPKYAGKYGAFLGANAMETVYTVPQNEGLPNLLLIGDSYIFSFASLISQHFHKTHLIYLRNSDTLNIGKIVKDRNISIVLILTNSQFVIGEKFNQIK